ncbi:hypothetical protein, partial [Klebsiella pneumoniae]|uniref:hypothetical protein n=1 Tax=Klebsiella pneumoniae TaxID=573 RepID=UPI003013529A
AATTNANGTTAGQDSSSPSASAVTATPQQTIANFLQNALAKLGSSANGSGGTLSARWGIQLLALVLPAYAQAQTTAGS